MILFLNCYVVNFSFKLMFHQSFIETLLCPSGLLTCSPPLISLWCRYILTSFYTKYDRVHFVVNTVSLLTVLIPKLPQLHGVRIFGINKYWQGGRGHLLPSVPVDYWEHKEYQASDLAADPWGSVALWLSTLLNSTLNEACWGFCRGTKP